MAQGAIVLRSIIIDPVLLNSILPHIHHCWIRDWLATYLHQDIFKENAWIQYNLIQFFIISTSSSRQQGLLWRLALVGFVFYDVEQDNVPCESTYAQLCFTLTPFPWHMYGMREMKTRREIGSIHYFNVLNKENAPMLTWYHELLHQIIVSVAIDGTHIVCKNNTNKITQNKK